LEDQQSTMVPKHSWQQWEVPLEERDDGGGGVRGTSQSGSEGETVVEACGGVGGDANLASPVK